MNTNITNHHFRLNITTLVFLLSTLNPQLSTVLAQGPLAPPGAPAPTMKSLDQVEPRIDVQKLPGDADNQFIISQPGSYYLSSNVVVSAMGVNGIAIQASNVTLDLNGFAVMSTGTDTGYGISTLGFVVANIAIKNGAVTDWGVSGIYAANATDSSFERLRLVGNGMAGAGDGISAGPGCQITNCIAKGNTAAGFNALGLASISHCISEFNIADGISVADGSRVVDCTLEYNGGNGIAAGAKCNIVDCLVTSSTINGIKAGNNGMVRGCTVSESGDDGIEIAGGCRVMENHCTNNGQSVSVGAGIHLVGARNHVEANTSMSNDFGLRIVNSFNIVIRNVAVHNGSGADNENYRITGVANLYGSIHPMSGNDSETNTLANLSSPF